MINSRVLHPLVKCMGFAEHEIIPFTKDILHYINHKGCHSKRELNAEMESLGWGIGVIDETMFHHLHSLIV